MSFTKPNHDCNTMQEGDTTASIAEECGITPTQLKMINTLQPVEESAHRMLHTKRDREEMLLWDAKKVADMVHATLHCVLVTHCKRVSIKSPSSPSPAPVPAPVSCFLSCSVLA